MTLSLTFGARLHLREDNALHLNKGISKTSSLSKPITVVFSELLITERKIGIWNFWNKLRPLRNAFILAECVAKREWRASWDWSDTSISVWVPEDSTESLNIRLGLNELHHADITFTRSSIVASTTKDLATDEWGRSENCTLEEGWRRVRLSLKTNYELHLGDCNGTSPISFPGDLLPEFPKWVEVTGSNITVNCEMDLLAWRVSRTAVAVPLDLSEWHRFSLYSVHEFSPRFVLENHRIDLGIGNSGLSTLDLKHKLPAFVQHNLSLACARNANFSSCEFTVSAVISLSNWNYLRSCPVVHAKAMQQY
ncbi:uncharacterized protein LOC119570693 [Penaeus monodon]|uniref:uncharacterized protein LOC119570693 n=1 Tax=Penaeus monodon TaxID=6687 RepID=UPI0018A74340|nr:uncharacterized protein LOC119570693 [Penaeus monodon]